MLHLAHSQRATPTLILGAWGCGVFQNSPEASGGMRSSNLVVADHGEQIAQTQSLLKCPTVTNQSKAFWLPHHRVGFHLRASNNNRLIENDYTPTTSPAKDVAKLFSDVLHEQQFSSSFRRAVFAVPDAKMQIGLLKNSGLGELAGC